MLRLWALLNGRINASPGSPQALPSIHRPMGISPLALDSTGLTKYLETALNLSASELYLRIDLGSGLG